MKADFTQKGLEGGLADIVLTLDAGESFAPDDTIALARGTASGMEYLDRGRWGVKKTGLLSRGQASGTKVTFRLESDYVDCLDKPGYLLTLLDAQGNDKYEVEILLNNGVKKSPREPGTKISSDSPPARGAAVVSPAPPVVEPPSPQAVEPPPLPVPEPPVEPGEARVVELADEPARPPVVEPPAEPASSARADGPPVDREATRRRGGAGVIFAAIAALLAVAGLAGFFLMRSPTVAVPPGPIDGGTVGETNNGTGKGGPAPVIEDESDKNGSEAPKADIITKNAKTRVAEFFAAERKGERTAEGAMQLAAELVADTPEQQDAVLRLYYYAAGENHALGSLKYAECLDPSLPPFGTIGKDAAEAWSYYGKHADGAIAREKMKTWVQDAADRGDANAREWLKALQ